MTLAFTPETLQGFLDKAKSLFPSQSDVRFTLWASFRDKSGTFKSVSALLSQSNLPPTLHDIRPMISGDDRRVWLNRFDTVRLIVTSTDEAWAHGVAEVLGRHLGEIEVESRKSSSDKHPVLALVIPDTLRDATVKDLDFIFKTDRVDIFEPDMTPIKADVPAQVDGNEISISDVSIPIRHGYLVRRRLPAGFAEEYVVEDPGFTQGMPPAIAPNYRMKVRHKDAPPRHAAGDVYNVTGTGARVNIDSYDASHNVIFQGSPSELFEQLRKVASTLPVSDREPVLQSIGSMEAAQGKPTFLDRYTDFMALVASHVTVFAPMIPALTALLPHAR